METIARNYPSVDDRIAIRRRPDGSPVMYQTWDTLLFMHWPVPIEILRPLIPERLGIDLFNGTAWVSITPFTIRDARPPFLVPIPWISDFHEVNVRTYVHLNGVPGIWFFSLDTNSTLSVVGARTFFHLPYFKAEMSLEQQGRTIAYSSVREGEKGAARFDGIWTIGNDMPSAEPGTLLHFLVERYCLYSYNEGTLYRCRIFHQPWPLQEAHVLAYTSTMVEAVGLPTPAGEPLLQCGGPVDVGIWGLDKV